MPEERGPARTVRKAMPAVTNHQVEPERISVRLNERFADGINDAIKRFIIEQSLALSASKRGGLNLVGYAACQRFRRNGVTTFTGGLTMRSICPASCSKACSISFSKPCRS